MATFSKPPTTSTLNPDVEPDEQWKSNLRKQIENGLRDMYDDAKKSLDDKLKAGPVDAATRESLTAEHLTTMGNIRRLAAEQFDIGLERERQERRWAADIQMAPGWNDVLVKEQQAILDNIKKDDSQSERAPHRASSSPTEDRGQLGARANARAQREASHLSSISHPVERPPERWSSQPLVEEPEEMDMSNDERVVYRHAIRPPERPFEPSTERSMRSPSEADFAWRPPASSPPKSHPEFWKPSISPADDAAASRRFISRRSSAASIGSMGSTNYRPPIPNQIPESPSHYSVNMAGNSERDRIRSQATDLEWTTAREKEWQGQVRTTNETSILPEEYVVSPISNVRAAEGQSRMYPPSRPITNRQSSQNLRTDVPIPPSRHAESQSPMYIPSFAITNQQSSQTLHYTDVPTPVPISTSRPAVSQSRTSHPPSAINQQSSQNLRAEGPTNVPTPVLVSPSRLAESQSRIYPPSSARAIPKKRPSKNLVFDEDPPLGSAGTSWLESPAQLYGPTPPASRPITHKASFILDDPGHQPSPTARAWPAPSRPPADSRYERDFPRSARPPDGDLGWHQPLRPQMSALDVRLNQQDHHHYDRRGYADDSDEEYGDLEEQRVADVGPRTRHRMEGHNDEEAKRKEAVRLREQAARLEEEVLEAQRQRDEEVEAEMRRERFVLREEELRKEKEDARRLEEEVRKRDNAKREEEEAKRKEEEKRKEEDARRKEDEARRKEDARRKEEARKEETRREEARREAAEAKRKAEEKEEETRKKEVEIRKREEEVKRREEEMNRREAEAKLKEREKQREEAEAKLKEKEKQDLQQEEFRKREEEIRRRADQRKRQDSTGSYSESRDRAGSTTYPSASPTTPNSSWSGLNRSGSTATNATDRSSTSSSSRSSTTSSTWSSATRPSSTSSTQASSAARPPTTPTGAKSGGGPGGPQASPAPMSESEWARRQAEQAKKQQEQFRLEQERLERDRQAKVGKIMTKEEMIQLFETHHRQWAQISSHDALHWDSFPWPMLRRPLVPDELTTTAIGAYVLSPHYPGDAAKSSKDRIKDHIKRWHPDRFETKLLPKVIEGEQEKVKQGAGLVARCLNDLLTRSNVSTMFS